MDLPAKTIYVKNVRRDGKLTVIYVFPLNGTRLTKIISREQLALERIKGYRIDAPFMGPNCGNSNL